MRISYPDYQDLPDDTILAWANEAIDKRGGPDITPQKGYITDVSVAAQLLVEQGMIVLDKD